MNAVLYNRVNVRLNAFKVDPVTSGIHEMVKRTLKILKQMMQDF